MAMKNGGNHVPVTPTLFLGAPPPGESVEVSTVDEAISVITTGRTAVLPEGSWEEAEKVVEHFSDRSNALWRIELARSFYPR
jgi:hypothetical protein